jgi:enamine deaminase RidA (YjgF/YER057c/UK114 family)
MIQPDSVEFGISNFCFSPESGKTFVEMLNDCYRQFADGANRQKFSTSSVIKQTIFISVSDAAEFVQARQELLGFTKNFFTELPPTSIIPQSPDSGLLMLEIMVLEGDDSVERNFRNIDNLSWLTIKSGTFKMLIASGLSESVDSCDILQQSTIAFGQLNDVLTEENMAFSDIVRQWNYIENITGNVMKKHQLSQYYQVFNDIRSKFYRSSEFVNGFPAATGIGIDFGGVIIDVIAIADDRSNSIVPIKSPVQIDAHKYSADVLADNHLRCDLCRTTPKFERAKMVITPDNKLIFISGTAAISGQESSGHQTVELQTKETIENIRHLISLDNLDKHGIGAEKEAAVTQLRVYVKYKSHVPQVSEVCRKYFKDIPISFVVADVCRPELLVEIEGQAILN